MAKVIFSIVDDDPSRDVMYKLNRINEDATSYKWTNNPARFEIVKTKTLNGHKFNRTKIVIHCNIKDKIFWLGVWQGKDLGINIAKQMYSLS